jgi:hypothetical protein
MPESVKNPTPGKKGRTFLVFHILLRLCLFSQAASGILKIPVILKPIFRKKAYYAF